jgi:glycosyltransferase involved in cell wall biosynthesis
MPAVSVITTAFNAERFIGDAMRSVLDQQHVDFEYIIVDDGSTDGTQAVVRSMADSRVRLIAPGRIGRGRALNAALDACRADYVAIQDADDLSHPERLATEYRVLEERPDLAGVGSGQILMSGDSPPTWHPVPPRPDMHDIRRELLYFNPLSHTSLMFRRHWLERVGGYDATRTVLFDWNLYIRLVSIGGKLARLSTPLVGKRIHGAQFFEGRRRTRYALACFTLQCQAVTALRRNPMAAAVFPALLAYRLMPRPPRLWARRRLTDQ